MDRTQPRTHGVEQRVGILRDEKNDRVPGRLLQGLEQRVLRRQVERFRVVDNRRAYSPARRFRPQVGDQLADLLIST